jgi:hypothetical protein
MSARAITCGLGSTGGHPKLDELSVCSTPLAMPCPSGPDDVSEARAEDF